MKQIKVMVSFNWEFHNFEIPVKKNCCFRFFVEKRKNATKSALKEHFMNYALASKINAEKS